MSGAPSSVRSPIAGDILDGKYRVEHVLGEGGMGFVVAAQHLRLDQRVAIKFLRTEALEHPEIVDRFAREARVAAKVRSEHVARVIDVGEFASGAPYMVLEYLDGEDLAQVLEQRGPLPVETAVDYILQVCEALAEAHVAGIVHRDLKPANLFLARKPNGSCQIKLLDFGISKARAGPDAASPRLGTTQGVLGTPCYMSPEQVRSAADLDARSDIWALGVLLFEFLSGSVPFFGADMAAIVTAIVAQKPPRLNELRADVPVELAAIVQRCLEKNREQRFPDTLRLVRALAPFAPQAAERSIPHIASVIGGSLETERPPPGDTHEGVALSTLAGPSLRLGVATERHAAQSATSRSKRGAMHTPGGSLASRPSSWGGVPRETSARFQATPRLLTVVAGLVLVTGAIFWLRRPTRWVRPAALSVVPSADPLSPTAPLPLVSPLASTSLLVDSQLPVGARAPSNAESSLALKPAPAASSARSEPALAPRAPAGAPAAKRSTAAKPRAASAQEPK